MTKEEAKHLSEVLKAYSDGKTIQKHEFGDYGNQIYDKWVDIETLTSNLISDWELRIKPKPVLRPYKSAEEFLKAQKEHGPGITLTDNSVILPIKIYGRGIEFREVGVTHTYAEILKYNTWQDGTRCGIEE